MGARLASVTHSTSDAEVPPQLPRPRAPRIVALGGSTKPMAASERALRIAGAAAAAEGADVRYVTGRDLLIPIYDTESDERSPGAVALVERDFETFGFEVALVVREEEHPLRALVLPVQHQLQLGGLRGRGRCQRQRKADRLPHEAGLRLLAVPRAPKELPVSALIRNPHGIADWELFV